ncbi:EAL domain-containing protein [Arhodomonas sp. SL1]|uniref:EAL domain-containing protein n=1 Tax=Arhodomonas sp. SL1 TaxID=3425691 RepID=UPI003F880407
MLIIIAAGLMPRVLTGEEEVLRAGVYDNPPRLFVNDAGDADGFWAELLDGIAAEEGWRVEWVPVSWKDGLQRLEQGRLDIMPDVARTAAREQRLALSEERVLTSWSRVYATAPAQLESVLDLAGRRIASLEGSVNLDGPGGIRELLHAFDIEATLVTYPGYTEAFEALADERVDAVVANKDIGNRLYRDYGAVMTPVVFQPADLVFAYPPGMPGEAGFPRQIDEHLRTMKADPESRYYALQAQWLGGAQPGEGLVPSWVYWVLAALGVSVLGLIAGNLVLERRVRRHSAALHESNATLSAIHDASPDMILLIGADDRIHSANRRYYEITGYPEAETLDRDPSAIAGGVLHPGLPVLAKVRAGEGHRYEAELPTRSGERLPVEVRLRHLPGDASPSSVLAVIRDLTPLRTIEDQLRHQATHDSLTGLPNRSALDTKLEQAVLDCRISGERHALCYMDVDQFRLINDIAGHAAGDAVLQSISEILRTQVHHGDMLARFGGDELTLLLWGCEPDKAVEIADGHRASVEATTFVHEGRRFQLTLSIGVVPIDEHAGDAGIVLAAADAACHLAKEQGGNQIHLHDTEDAALQTYRSHMEWAQELHDALRNDRFRLLCQPIVATRAADGGAPHYEILLRMSDTDGGEVSPDTFFPVAERYGMAARVDQWVIEHALAQVSAAGPADACWSINLSGHSLASSEVLTAIEGALERYRIDPQRLTFEITETSVVRNFNQATAFIERLHELGCTLALDDFGTGLSSFSYLKHLKVDVLKLDGVFIRDLLEDQRNEAMVTAFTQLAGAYGLTTVAEFVSSDALRQRLARLGVDFVQGYTVGRPQPLEEVLAGAPPVLG